VFVSSKNFYTNGFVDGLVNEMKWEYEGLLGDQANSASTVLPLK
jgi:hypothetical protein